MKGISMNHKPKYVATATREDFGNGIYIIWKI